MPDAPLSPAPRTPRGGPAPLVGPAWALLGMAAASAALFTLFHLLKIVGLVSPDQGFVVNLGPIQGPVAELAAMFLYDAWQAGIAFGAWCMLTGRNRTAALAGAGLSLVPCCSPCLFLGLIPGAWALIVLLRSDIRDAFQS